MKVFMSSIRRGLEEERDALPGLIRALGHEPTRFEDYTAMDMPSRQACLEGVEDADVYLLLLGASYGDPLPDTGKAPTEEEFTVARRRGIPILAFRKLGVAPEPKQDDFIARIEEYARGKFRASFSTTPELLAVAAAALREAEKVPPALVWTPLANPPEVSWVIEPERIRGFIAGLGAVLELHAIPVSTGERLSVGHLDGMGPRLAGLGRDTGHFAIDAALDVVGTADMTSVAVQAAGRPVGEQGMRVSRDRTTVIWTALDRDELGTIVDPDDVQAKIEKLLRIVAEMRVLDGAVCFAVSLGPLDSSQEGSIAELGRRSSASFGMGTNETARVYPDDAVPIGSLGRGASEIAEELRARLIHAYRATRR